MFTCKFLYAWYSWDIFLYLWDIIYLMIPVDLRFLRYLRDIIYLTVPVDLRFLRYFSGTDASSWHSFSAHSLNPRPELSPPATCHRLKRGRFRCLGSHSIHRMPCNISRLRSQFLIFSNVSSLTLRTFKWVQY